MRTITPLDLRQHLGQLLDAASAGERFVVERNRRPLAMLVSIEDGRRLDDDPADRRARALAALDRLAALGARLAEERPSALTALEAVRRERDRDVADG
ncbi:MAG TPA: type II toxin-antitoxin system prevent-host-death family antitoxin [Candidatus Limnocylindrales bacterium]|nr:type II toxin-antitoxin system prevent-host-death family antitoxin [Candidatus Limnocylindrales bacterium]